MTLFAKRIKPDVTHDDQTAYNNVCGIAGIGSVLLNASPIGNVCTISVKAAQTSHSGIVDAKTTEGTLQAVTVNWQNEAGAVGELKASVLPNKHWSVTLQRCGEEAQSFTTTASSIPLGHIVDSKAESGTITSVVAERSPLRAAAR